MKQQVSAAPVATRKKSGALARIGLVLAALAGLMMLFAILVVLINLPDRALDEEAKTWQSRAVSASAGADPAAVDRGASLWALDAPADVDASKIGRAIDELYRARSRAQMAAGDWGVQPFYPADPLILPLELGCIERASACVSNALSHSNIVRDLAQRRGALLHRLDLLDGGPFVELAPPLEPHAPSAQYASLIAGHSLSLALAAVDIGDGHLDAGTERLERMTRVPRRMLAGCQTLACKLAAAGMLRRAFLVYSELMSQTTAITTLAPSLERAGAPLSAAELDLRVPLALELQLARRLDEDLAHPAGGEGAGFKESLAVRLAPLFLKENATFNRQVELAEIEAPFASASAQVFASEEARLSEAFSHRAEQIGATSLASLYNPLGRVLVSGLPSIRNAAAQLHDLEGLAAAVHAKAALLSQHIRAANAQAFLDQKPAGLVDPYSGEALTFSVADRLLMIPQRGPRPVPQLRVGLDP
jgi:hypothetical protein